MVNSVICEVLFMDPVVSLQIAAELAKTFAEYLIFSKQRKESERQEIIQGYLDWLRRKEHQQEMTALEELCRRMGMLSYEVKDAAHKTSASLEDLRSTIVTTQIDAKVAEQVNKHVLFPLAEQLDLEISWNLSDQIIQVGPNTLEVYRPFSWLPTVGTKPVWGVFGNKYPSLYGLVDLHDILLERVRRKVASVSELLHQDQQLLGIIKPNPTALLKDTPRVNNVVHCLMNRKQPQDEQHKELFAKSGEALEKLFQDAAGETMRQVRRDRDELNAINLRLHEGCELLRTRFVEIGVDVSVSVDDAEADRHGFFQDIRF